MPTGRVLGQVLTFLWTSTWVKEGKLEARTYGLLEFWPWDRLKSTAAVWGVWLKDMGRFESLEMGDTTLKALGTRQDVVVTRKIIWGAEEGLMKRNVESREKYDKQNTIVRKRYVAEKKSGKREIEWNNGTGNHRWERDRNGPSFKLENTRKR